MKSLVGCTCLSVLSRAAGAKADLLVEENVRKEIIPWNLKSKKVKNISDKKYEIHFNFFDIQIISNKLKYQKRWEIFFILLFYFENCSIFLFPYLFIYLSIYLFIY